MNNINLTAIIQDIQTMLVSNPYDLAHDILHHYRVYEWAMRIIQNEKLTVDHNLMILACWLHDFGGRSGQRSKLITQLLKRHDCKDDFIVKIIDVIKEHSFGQRQTQLESKILFDADKLEYANPFRLSWFIQATKDGYINQATYMKYKQEWHERIGQVKDMLHFPYAKKAFLEMLSLAYKIMGRKMLIF